ncbi:HU family DNA-binding protein [Xylanibacter muris]|uniref:LysM peptidoglycan-binding domain-containing protein n=1 Tax=Xylanibacter muris TaxID=2736290 RepID=A0ABX2ANN8_9BACT|nr:HU family DNA-binding protein [Xylanibacter muris]NPD92856.1 LysM peptidoglycan-binding domain-containing protein [Xylanibacter muris]
MQRKTVEDIAGVLVSRSGLSQEDAISFVNALFDTVRRGLERDKVLKIKGFGTFKIISVEARKSVNVNTGEAVIINGHEKITFTPDSTVKDLVNKPFSQFETVILNDGVEFEDTNIGGTLEESAYNDDSVSDENEPVESPVLDKGPSSEADGRPLFDLPVAQDYLLVTERGQVSSEHVLGEDTVSKTEVEEMRTFPAASIDNVEGRMEEDICGETENKAGLYDGSHGELQESDIESYGINTESSEKEVLLPETETTVSEDNIAGDYSYTVQQDLHETTDGQQTCEDNGVSEAVVTDSYGKSDGVAVQTEAVSDEESEDISDDKDSKKKSDDERFGLWVTLTWIFVTLVLMAVSAFGGYLYRMYEVGGNMNIVSADVRISEDESDADMDKESRSSDAARRKTGPDSIKAINTVVRKDTLAKPVIAEKTTAVADNNQTADKKSETVDKRSADAENKQETMPDYGSMDIRVRTGAYNIVGLNQVYTVKSGESIESISKRFLGEGMECYVEVYNGLKPNTKLTPGQKINIPKLKWKKRRN